MSIVSTMIKSSRLCLCFGISCIETFERASWMYSYTVRVQLKEPCYYIVDRILLILAYYCVVNRNLIKYSCVRCMPRGVYSTLVFHIYSRPKISALVYCKRIWTFPFSWAGRIPKTSRNVIYIFFPKHRLYTDTVPLM